MPARDMTTTLDGRVHVAWATGTDARSTVLRRLLHVADAEGDAVTHACPTCGSTSHGPLRTSSGSAVLSLSHAGDVTVGAIARADAAASVGVDIEADRGDEPMADLAALFAPGTPPTVRDWTMIEAAVKADGRGLRIPPSLVRLGEGLAHVEGRTPIELTVVTGPAGYLISVAIDPAR